MRREVEGKLAAGAERKECAGPAFMHNTPRRPYLKYPAISVGLLLLLQMFTTVYYGLDSTDIFGP